MYVLELVLGRTHYHCSKILIRFRHRWLERALRPELVRELLESAIRSSRIVEMQRGLRPGEDIELRSPRDVEENLARFNLDKNEKALLTKYFKAVGWYNALQSVISNHILTIVYGASVGCLKEDVLCVVEPRIEVSDHRTSVELERKGMLPYRLFDLAVVEHSIIKFVELKYSKPDRASLPGGTVLAYLASFMEKVASTHIHIGEALREAGYSYSYELVVITSPHVIVHESIMSHLDRIAESLTELLGTSITIRVTSYNALVAHVDPSKPLGAHGLVKERHVI